MHLLRILARLVVGLHPPSFRRRFGEELRRDYRRLLLEEAGRDRGGRRRILRRMARDVGALPGLWLRARPTVGSDALEDMGFAVRGLRRDPAFTWVVVGVLGVGMGLATAVWAVRDAYLLRGFPFPDAERLVSVRPVAPVAWSDPELEGLLEPPISWDLDAFTLVDGHRPRQVLGQWVAPGFLEAFGAELVLGRGFLPEEGRPGSPSVLVLSHRLWQERYEGDPEILGRTIRAFSSDRPEDAEVFTVVGVLAPDFWFFNDYTEVLAPLRADNPVYMGRMAPGVSAERVGEVLTRLGKERLESAPPDFRVDVRSHQDRYVEGIRPVLAVLGSGAALVLLIACGNVAMLLMVRTGRRSRELAVRMALGAPRSRILRQLLAEGLLLASASAVVGVLAAALLLEGVGAGVEARLGVGIPGGVGALGVGLGGLARMVGVASGVGLILGLTSLVGALPATTVGLARRGRGSVGSRRSSLVRNGLVGLELALSLALLIGAGLALRSALHLSRVDLGFDPEGVTAAQVSLRLHSYPEAPDRLEFWNRFRAEVAAIPGVEAAGLTVRAPFLWRYNPEPMESEEAAGTSPDRLPGAVGQVAGSGYLETLRIPVVRGRAFGPEDATEAEPTVIVSESLAEALWPGRDPLGRRLRQAPEPLGSDEAGPWRRVVGVVPDVWNSLELGAAPDYYVPLAQLPSASMTVVVRTRPRTPPPLQEMEEILAGLDPDVPLSRVEGLDAATAGAVAPARFLAGALGVFSTFAVLLAVIGLYGVVSYAAARRNRDIAIRMALGADRRRVVRLFMAETAGAVAAGIILGLMGGRVLSQALAGQLRGVAPDDPLTFAVLSLVLGIAALGASWVPARRASRADPADAMRTE